MEKAWARAMGSYVNANGGFTASGIRTITGAPVFHYSIDLVGPEPDGENTLFTLDEAFELLRLANQNNYIMGAGTEGKGDDSQVNWCGIAKSHAYAIMDAFEMVDANEVSHRVVMLRNPWGTSYYNQTWSSEDPNWTDELVAQVPLGIDPRIDQKS